MGRPAGWMKELTGRSAMKSPGKPSRRREVELWFWREIAKGLSSEDAAGAVGVSTAAGVRWFVSVAEWPRCLATRPRAGTCALPSARESLPRAGACARSRARSAGRRRRSRVSCTQRGDSRRQAGVPGVGGAVEGRAGGAPPEDGQACRRSPTARVRAGPPGRQGPATGRDRGGRSGDRAVEGPQQAA